MNVFKIEPTVLDGEYKGAGWALAAIQNNKVIKLIYLDDVFPDLLPDLEDDTSGEFDTDLIMDWIKTEAAGKHIRELQALGDVSVGMCSCGEFIEQ